VGLLVGEVVREFRVAFEQRRRFDDQWVCTCGVLPGA